MCGAATRTAWACTDCAEAYVNPGTCPNGACATRPALEQSSCCVARVHRHGEPCAGHGAPYYYCGRHRHLQDTGGACTVCNGELREIRDFALVGNAPTPTPSAPPKDVADGAGTWTKVTEREVVDADPRNESGKKIGYERTPVASTPSQDEYFAGPGNVVVYEVLEVPPAETV
jgi:hypothetical protein